MKRVHVLRRPMDVTDIDQLDQDEFEQQSERKATKDHVRRWRQIKHQTV
jgi:hypothetical protein